MGAEFRFDRFNLERIEDFVLRNLKAMGFDMKMDPDMIRARMDAEGVVVDADASGFYVKKNGLIVAQLSRKAIVNKKWDGEMYPDLQTVDPARRISVLVSGNGGGK